MNTAVATTSYASIFTVSPQARLSFAALIAKLFMANFRTSVGGDNEGASFTFGL